jgi:hypothetical protein
VKIKEDKDARKIAKNILKKYGKHEIHTITHATGTNVWTVGARTEELEIVLSLDEETGKMFDNPTEQRTVKREIVEDLIKVTDRISIVVKNFYEKVNWKFLIATIGLTVSGSIVSAFFSPVWGIPISLVFGGLSILYGKYAFTQIEKITISK